MRKLILVALLVSMSSYGQLDSLTKLSYEGTTIRFFKPTVQRFVHPIKASSIEVDSLFFTGMKFPVSKILVIMPNGDVYYDPKNFCDCRKCKKFDGLKKLKQ